MRTFTSKSRNDIEMTEPTLNSVELWQEIAAILAEGYLRLLSPHETGDSSQNVAQQGPSKDLDVTAKESNELDTG